MPHHQPLFSLTTRPDARGIVDVLPSSHILLSSNDNGNYHPTDATNGVPTPSFETEPASAQSIPIYSVTRKRSLSSAFSHTNTLYDDYLSAQGLPSSNGFSPADHIYTPGVEVDYSRPPSPSNYIHPESFSYHQQPEAGYVADLDENNSANAFSSSSLEQWDPGYVNPFSADPADFPKPTSVSWPESSGLGHSDADANWAIAPTVGDEALGLGFPYGYIMPPTIHAPIDTPQPPTAGVVTYPIPTHEWQGLPIAPAFHAPGSSPPTTTYPPTSYASSSSNRPLAPAVVPDFHFGLMDRTTGYSEYLSYIPQASASTSTGLVAGPYAVIGTSGDEEEHLDEREDDDEDTVQPTSSAAPEEPSSSAVAEKKIPRPANKFILYRSDWTAENKGRYDASIISNLAGKAWRAESAEVEKRYTNLAKEEKARHRLKFPNYVYQPKRPAKKVKLDPVPATKPRASGKVWKATGKGKKVVSQAASSVPSSGFDFTFPFPSTS